MPPTIPKPPTGRWRSAIAPQERLTGIRAFARVLLLALLLTQGLGDASAQSMLAFTEPPSGELKLAHAAMPLMLEDEEATSTLPAPTVMDTDEPAPADPLQAQIQALSKRIEELEKSQAASSKTKEGSQGSDKKEAKSDSKDKKEADKADKTKVSEWTDLSEDKWTIKLGGHIQMDYINWADTDPNITDPLAVNQFNYRRLRLVADGTGYGVFDFRLQMTLEPGQGLNTNNTATPDVKDAYLSMNEIPLLGRMRVGNFFVPFGLEQVTNDTNNIFVERSIPTQGIFTADREVGIAFYNCTPDQRISWTTGMFFDSISDTFKTRFDDNQGYRMSGRLVYLPYYDEPSGGRYLVHTALGVLHTDDNDDTVRFAARPQIQKGPILIDTGNLAADDYTTGNAELAVVWGRITSQSEAYVSTVNMLNGDTHTVGGAYTHLSWFLTGESRVYERFGQHGAQFGRNKPFSNFFATPGGVSWGAWEAKARWSYLDLTSVNQGQYNDSTFGFNWYWSDRMRWMFDWIHPWTDSQTVFGDTSSDLLALRLDFNW